MNPFRLTDEQLELTAFCLVMASSTEEQQVALLAAVLAQARQANALMAQLACFEAAKLAECDAKVAT